MFLKLMALFSHYRFIKMLRQGTKAKMFKRHACARVSAWDLDEAIETCFSEKSELQNLGFSILVPVSYFFNVRIETI